MLFFYLTTEKNHPVADADTDADTDIDTHVYYTSSEFWIFMKSSSRVKISFISS